MLWLEILVLAVVQGIVQSCNGAVTVGTSESKGASFIIHLPVIHTDEPAKAKLDEIIPGGNERILFVDDEPPLAMDLTSGEIKTIIWATGFRPDLSYLDVPVLDEPVR